MAVGSAFIKASAELGYTQPNTFAVERFNATARRMNPHQVRRSLAFAHRPQSVMPSLGGLLVSTIGCVLIVVCVNASLSLKASNAFNSALWRWRSA